MKHRRCACERGGMVNTAECSSEVISDKGQEMPMGTSDVEVTGCLNKVVLGKESVAGLV